MRDPESPLTQNKASPPRFSDIQKRYEEPNLRMRLLRTLRGLGQPRTSGDYKFAKLQIQLMAGPLLAILIPLLCIAILVSIEPSQTLHDRIIPTEFVEPTVLPDIEPPPPDVSLDSEPILDAFDLPIESIAPDPSTAVTSPEPLTPRPESFTTVSMVRSPIIMRDIYSHRSEAGRAESLRRFSGRHGRETEAAVIRALEWLKRNQLEDGSWQGLQSARSKTAMTGLGLLTFLAHGETPSSERYGQTVLNAIQFLVQTDQRPDGTFRHTEGGNRGGVYAHGIATYALSETYALTRVPMVRPAMDNAVAHIVRGQRPDGGYDYRFAPDGGERNRCTSVAGWMAQAMKAAHMAGSEVAGLDEAMARAAEGFKLQYRHDAGSFLYASKSGETRRSMIPIGTLCLQLLHHGRSAEVRGGLASLADWVPSWDNPDLTGGILEPVYVWYYATQTLFHQGGAAWDRWNNLFAPEIVRNQNEDGSWTFAHGRSEAYGPVYHTTLNALSLMVYYRYLPTFQTPQAIVDSDLADEDEISIRFL